MNLSEFIQKNRMDTGKAMNLLQSNGIISDNAVSVEDVAEADTKNAVRFLSGYLPCSLCGQQRNRCHC
jgi:hypothetical protein